MKALATLFICLAFGSSCFAQKDPIVFPLTAGQLQQLCKSYDLVQLEVDLKKNVGSEEVRAASSCLNFIMGVLSTIGSLDVGLFPELKYEIGDSSKQMPYKAFVDPFMKYIAAHPENEKEPAAAMVALSLMVGGILVPKHWEQRK
jgi:hypothetical protein